MTEFERLFQVSMRRLARRDRSLVELRTALEKAGGDSEITDQVLQKLVDLRYVDEERMAAAMIRDQRLQSRGPRAAWMKLKKRGVSGWSLERVEEFWRSELVSGESEEVLIARRWVFRRYRKLTASGLEGHQEKKRALSALLRRGYSYSVAQQAIQVSMDDLQEEVNDE